MRARIWGQGRPGGQTLEPRRPNNRLSKPQNNVPPRACRVEQLAQSTQRLGSAALRRPVFEGQAITSSEQEGEGIWGGGHSAWAAASQGGISSEGTGIGGSGGAARARKKVSCECSAQTCLNALERVAVLPHQRREGIWGGVRRALAGQGRKCLAGGCSAPNLPRCS